MPALAVSSSYDAIARLYDPWSRSVTEDVDFYVAQARKSGGPVVELGVGTGRIAVPVAAAGVQRDRGRRLRGDARRLRRAAPTRPVSPSPSTLRARRPPTPAGRGARPARHLPVSRAPPPGIRRRAPRTLRARATSSCARAAASSSTSSRPSMEDVEETHGRWIEREPGIWERADWDHERRVLTLAVRGTVRRDGDAACLALTRGVAPAARAGRVRRRGDVRLVRPRARTTAARTRSGSPAAPPFRVGPWSG